MNKSKSYESGLGDFMLPFVELFSLIFVKIAELLSKFVTWGFSTYVLKNKKGELSKIERSSLRIRKSTTDEGAVGYSVNQKRDIYFDDLNKGKHSAIVGASGFGKTVLIDTLMHDDLKSGKPVIFLDPKGDSGSLNQFIDLCKLTGRDFAIFSEHYTGVNAINLSPCKEGSVTHIADRIHSAFEWSEEHYKTLCYNALKTTIKELKAKKETVTFASILNMLNFLSKPESKTRKFNRSDIQGLILRLENITESDFGKKLNQNGLSMDMAWTSNKCIYIGLPVLGYPKVARSLGKIILGDLSYAVYNKYKKLESEESLQLKNVGVYIDELSAIITDEFIELLNKCRGVGMELNFAFQSPSDISKIDPNLCQQILENSSNWFILKQRMEDASNMISKAIGTTLGKRETVRMESGQAMDQGSMREVEELLVHANLLKNLNPGQCVLLRHDPSQIDLVNIKYLGRDLVKDNIKFLNFLSEEVNCVK